VLRERLDELAGNSAPRAASAGQLGVDRLTGIIRMIELAIRIAEVPQGRRHDPALLAARRVTMALLAQMVPDEAPNG
jgi:hypothetical protein